MTDYSELVKALRYCAENGDFKCGKDCPMRTEYPNCLTKMDTDAADEIEALVKINHRFRELLDNRNKDVAELQRKVDELTSQLQKRGEWIGKSDDDSLVKCSVCGHIRIGSSLWYCKQYVPYCENCGAKMMEVQDGE